MRPECKDLIESWHRINSAIAQRRQAVLDAAIRQHVALFPKERQTEAEERAQSIVAYCKVSPAEVETRLLTAEKTLSQPIDSFGYFRSLEVAAC